LFELLFIRHSGKLLVPNGVDEIGTAMERCYMHHVLISSLARLPEECKSELAFG